MGDPDLSTQFRAICKKAEIAQEKIDDASRNRLRTEVPGTHVEPSDAAAHRETPDSGQDKAPEPWQEVRDRWRRHVAKVKEDIKKQRADVSVSEAVQNAGMAESYARGAIEFALDAVDEAEEAVLDALQVRARANALVS